MRILALLALAACTDGASADLGLGAMLRVDGAQFRPGPFPRDTGGPDGLQISTAHTMLEVGPVREPVRGVLEPSARGAVIGLADYDGSWIIPASAPDFETPDNPSAMATVGLAADFPPGPFTLLVAGSDAQGRF